MKIYISGCGGMLGEAFHELFTKEYTLKCTDIDVNEEWLTYCDFRDFDLYRKDVIEFKPDLLFHLGAFTDLEYCELHPEETYATNTISVENAVYIANELGIPMLYISTAGIFDGKKELYDDWDIPNPLGHYAKSKYAGEVFVFNRTEKSLICRAGWMMGGGPKKDKKFVQKIIKQIKNGKKELHIVNDKLGTPTYTHAFARNVKLLLEKQYWGIYNMVCSGLTSRLEVSKEIVKLLNLNDQIRITEVSSDFFNKEYFAPRPESERLVNRKLELRNLDIMPNWKVSLKKYITKYYKNYL